MNGPTGRQANHPSATVLKTGLRLSCGGLTAAWGGAALPRGLRLVIGLLPASASPAHDAQAHVILGNVISRTRRAARGRSIHTTSFHGTKNVVVGLPAVIPQVAMGGPLAALLLAAHASDADLTHLPIGLAFLGHVAESNNLVGMITRVTRHRK